MGIRHFIIFICSLLEIWRTIHSVDQQHISVSFVGSHHSLLTHSVLGWGHASIKRRITFYVRGKSGYSYALFWIKYIRPRDRQPVALLMESRLHFIHPLWKGLNFLITTFPSWKISLFTRPFFYLALEIDLQVPERGLPSPWMLQVVPQQHGGSSQVRALRMRWHHEVGEVREHNWTMSCNSADHELVLMEF